MKLNNERRKSKFIVGGKKMIKGKSHLKNKKKVLG
jgi:hypothetical protein